MPVEDELAVEFSRGFLRKKTSRVVPQFTTQTKENSNDNIKHNFIY